MSSELYCVPHNVYLIPHNGFCSHWQHFEKLAIFDIKFSMKTEFYTDIISGCALNARPSRLGFFVGDWKLLYWSPTGRQDIIVHISIMCTCIMSIKVSQYSSVATVINCNSCFTYQNNTLLLH